MLDLEPIRSRLAVIDPVFWRDACAPEEGDEDPEERVFVANAPDDIAALIGEVERLRAELADTRATLQDTEDDLCEARERLTDLDIDL